MIISGSLTAEQRHRSQFNYNCFNTINGLSYMCLGETIIILLAVRIHCPDYIMAFLSGMLYLGYLLLPLGKVTTAKIGSARSLATFWILRNMAALLVAASAPVTLLVSHKLGMALLLLGAFLFYGFRAAGVVMAQPLMGEFTTDEDRAGFIARSNCFFYLANLVALLVISYLLYLSDNLLMLTGVIIVGSLFGFVSSHFINQIDEGEYIRQSAQKSFRSEIFRAFNNPTFIRQILAGFVINMSIILLVPMSMVALKRCFGISDSKALYFSLAQFGSAALMSFLSGKIAEKIGPRKTILICYLLMVGIGPLWAFAPAKFTWWFQLFPFFLAGGCSVSMNNSMVHYFLQTVPERDRVGSSMLLATINGAGAGLIGMSLGAFALKFFISSPQEDILMGYKKYFIFTSFFLVSGYWIIKRLHPLPTEKRKIKRWWSFIDILN